MSVEPEDSQGLDSITIHSGFLVHGGGWAHCSFGQGHD